MATGVWSISMCTNQRLCMPRATNPWQVGWKQPRARAAPAPSLCRVHGYMVATAGQRFAAQQQGLPMSILQSQKTQHYPQVRVVPDTFNQKLPWDTDEWCLTPSGQDMAME